MIRTAVNVSGGQRESRLTVAAVHVNRSYRWPMLTLTAVCLALFSGCTLSYSHVAPWQRDMLARPGMQANAEPLTTACDDHISFSREASKGGRSYAGGGCGCN